MKENRRKMAFGHFSVLIRVYDYGDEFEALNDMKRKESRQTVKAQEIMVRHPGFTNRNRVLLIFCTGCCQSKNPYQKIWVPSSRATYARRSWNIPLPMR